MENVGSYISNMDDLSQEKIYLKRKLISFFESSCYVKGVVHSNMAAKKQRNRYIETHLLVDDGLKTLGISFSLSKYGIPFFLNIPLVFQFLTCPFLTL